MKITKELLLEKLPNLIYNQEVGILCDTDLFCADIFTHDTSGWEIVTIDEDNREGEVYVEVIQKYDDGEQNLYRIWVDKNDLK